VGISCLILDVILPLFLFNLHLVMVSKSGNQGVGITDNHTIKTCLA
jgi:hypothetical protein